MADDLDEIAVLVGDLRSLSRTLNAAYSASMAADLQEQYRQLSNRPRASNLTRSLETAFNKVEGYIKTAEDDEPDE